MAAPKRLVLFVEGQGDAKGVPALVKRLLTDLQAWDQLFLDSRPFTVHNIAHVTRNDCADWIRWLRDASKRPNVGAVLLLLDGDLERVRGEAFCPARFGAELSRRAREAGGGVLFSVATVFALQEFESWLIAGVESLAGQPLPEGRPGVRAGTAPPSGNLEIAARDAKGLLAHHMDSAYNPIIDQEAFAKMVDLGAIRQRQLRSFRRLEHALQQIADAVRAGTPIVTP